MNNYTKIINSLNHNPKIWLVTGAAGFIGSHLVEALLQNKQKVIGLDNLTSGNIENLTNTKENALFTFIEGDIRDLATCMKSCEAVDYVLHHAAIGSVTKSIEDPVLTDKVNNGGFINILLAAQKQQVKRVVYASSSAVYGEKGGAAEKNEDDLVDSLSPYAASKCANENYARALANTHKIETVGLRYFNIYGPRQDPNGAYAAVIPKWINTMLSKSKVEIFGDGTTVRDFCYIDDVVQANILAATGNQEHDKSPIYNIAAGQSTTLNELFSHLQKSVGYTQSPTYKDFRLADIKVSRANMSKAHEALEFIPSVSLQKGLEKTVKWYREQLNGS